ncbi:phosphopantetheine-binding protein [Curtobacterium flaccumfaciens]|uniref:phosphopantetheine-binding protein n=1 Tax=Curtobacterium flaccumfaciens TaxID=2035 RepID=UPI001600443A|nr:phosphopantetheine-binding protein [Curtobacterium flaccumfaciens]
MTLTREEIETTVTAALVEGAGVRNQNDIQLNTLLLEGGLSLSSLSFMELLIHLEDRLGVDLEDGVVMAADLRTVRDLVELVERAVEEESQ